MIQTTEINSGTSLDSSVAITAVEENFVSKAVSHAEPLQTKVCIFDSLGGRHKFRTVRILKKYMPFPSFTLLGLSNRRPPF